MYGAFPSGTQANPLWLLEAVRVHLFVKAVIRFEKLSGAHASNAVPVETLTHGSR